MTANPMTSSAENSPNTAASGLQDTSAFNVGDILQRHQQRRQADEPGSPESLDRQLSRTLTRLSSTLEQYDNRKREREHMTAIQNEWQHVALVVDRFLLVMFIILTLGVTGGIVFQAPLSWSFVFGWKA